MRHSRKIRHRSRRRNRLLTHLEPLEHRRLLTSIDLAALTGQEGLTIYGAVQGDRIGRSVSNAGDVNGDGFDDVIIGAPFSGAEHNGLDDAGESHVIFGGNDLSAAINLAELGDQGLTIYGVDANDESGWSVSNAGDVNSDGFDDLIIGARFADGKSNGNNSAGESYVIFGSDILPTAIDLAELGNQGITIYGADGEDSSGYAVSHAGDVNGDGYDDLIIGARRADAENNGRIAAGESYVIFGANNLPTSIDLSALGHQGITIYGADGDDDSGFAVSNAGDVNGDGYDDLIIGAVGAGAEDNRKTSAGESYVIFGSDDLPLTIDLADLGSQGLTIYGADWYDDSGWSVSNAGDVNGDGYDDLIIGGRSAWAKDNGRTLAGESYVIFGGGELPSAIDLAALGDQGLIIFGANLFDQSGYSVSGAGDVNGDGYDDLVIGAPFANEELRTQAGQSYVIFGSDSTVSAIDLKALGNRGLTIYGASTGDSSGFSVSNAGDVNSDGYDDLIIGAFNADAQPNGLYDVGKAYVIYGDDFDDLIANDDEFTHPVHESIELSVLGNDFSLADSSFTILQNTVVLLGATDENGAPIELVDAFVETATDRVVFHPGTDFDFLATSESATVTLEYSAVDSADQVSNVATVTLTLTGTNDAPQSSAFGPIYYVTLGATADTSLRSDAKDVAFGGDSELKTTQNVPNYVLTQFDVADVTGAVESAELSMEWHTSNVDNQGIVAYRFDRPWDELTSTWNNVDAGGDSFGALIGVPLDTANSNNLGTQVSGTFADWDVTDAVAEWVSGEADNNGLLLASYASAQTLSFWSKEGVAGTTPPQLTIGYRTPEDTSGEVVEELSPTDTGQLYFQDSDLNDQHSVRATFTSTTHAASEPFGELSVDLTNDTTGSGVDGVVTWTYTLGSAAGSLSEADSVTETHTVTIVDSEGSEITRDIEITVTGINDAPIAVEDSASTDQTAGVTIDVVANDSDPDTGDLVELRANSAQFVSAIDDLSGAAIELVEASLTESAGSLVFQPGSDFDYLATGETATVTIAYEAVDQDGLASQPSTVTITVSGTNDTPEFQTLGPVQYQTLPVIADTSLRGDDRNSINGAADELLTRQNDPSYALVQFDVASIPAPVVSADLTMEWHTSEVYNQGVGPYRFTKPWDEASTTWNNVNSGDDPFDATTGDVIDGVNSQVLGTQAMGEFAQWDVTAAAAEWVEGTTENHGLLFRSAASARPITFWSKESNQTAPQLVVGYREAENLEGEVVDNIAVPSLTDSGYFYFADSDGNETHEMAETTFVNSSHGLQLGELTATIENGTSDDGVDGVIRWEYSVSPADVQFLAASETLTEQFQLALTDSKGATATRDIAITVTGINDAPIAVEDSASTDQTAGVTIDVVANDSDPDTGDLVELRANSAQFVSAIDDLSGAVIELVEASLTESAGSLVFLPGSDFDYLATGETATVTIAYEAVDQDGLASQPSTVTITVLGTNDAPEFRTLGPVQYQTLPVIADTSLRGDDRNSIYGAADELLTRQNDPSYALVQFDVASIPAPVVSADLTMEWHTSEVYNQGVGPYRFTKPWDEATTTWNNVNGGNDPLNATIGDVIDGVNSQVLGTQETGEFAQWDVTAAAAEWVAGTAENHGLLFRSAASARPLTFWSKESSQTAPQLVVGYREAENLEGEVVDNIAVPSLTDSGFLYFADSDGNETHEMAETTFVNSSHGLQLGELTATLENGTSDDGVDGVIRWEYSVSSADIQFLAASETLTEQFELALTDSKGATATRDIAITVTGQNDAPTLGGDVDVQLSEDAPLTVGVLTISDPDQDEDQFVPLLTDGLYGTFSLSNAGNWTYELNTEIVQDLNDGETVTETFEVNSFDGATLDVVLTILGGDDSDTDGVDDAIESGAGDGNGDGTNDNEQDNVASLPNAVNGNYVTIAAAENLSSVASIDPKDSGIDVPPDVELPVGLLEFAVTVANPGDSASVKFYFDDADAYNSIYKYGPTSDNPEPHLYEFPGTQGVENGKSYIELHLTDGGAGDNDGVANGRIYDPVGLALVSKIGDDYVATAEDSSLIIEPLRNDVGYAGDIGSLTQPLNGTAQLLAGNNQIRYEPAANFAGRDEFTYSVLNQSGELIQATIYVHVTSVNDAPDIDVDPEYSIVRVNEGQRATAAGNWIDVDLNDAVNVEASLGVIELNASGRWSWSFDTVDGPSESQLVQLTARDELGATSTATFDLIVDNQPPSISELASSATVDQPARRDGPLVVTNMGMTTAGFQNSYGYYVKDSDGLPTIGQIVWSNTSASTGASFILADVDPADVGFFLVPNGAVLNPEVSDGSFVSFHQIGGDWFGEADGVQLVGQGTDLLFDQKRLNADKKKHVKDTSHMGNQNWEDLVGLGDRDFDDVNVNVARAATVFLDFSFVDPGFDDTHSVSIMWGDGTHSFYEAADLPTATDDGSFQVPHHYVTGGNFEVEVSVTDRDGAETSEQIELFVTGARVIPDGDLQIVGSASDDVVRLTATRPRRSSPASIRIDLNGGGHGEEYEFFATELNNIYIWTGDGDDNVRLDDSIDLAAWIYGGAGDDRLTGGAGADQIFGDAGDDRLSGGRGDDELLGGAGDDRLDGQRGSDILLGMSGLDRLLGGSGRDVLSGGTGSDRYWGGNHGDLLISVGSETRERVREAWTIWNSDESYEDRLEMLLASPLAASEIGDHDEDVDVLRGGGGQDAFFAMLGGLDRLVDVKKNEGVIP